MCEADPDLIFCDPLFVSIPFIVMVPEHSTLSKEQTPPNLSEFCPLADRKVTIY